MLVNKINNVTLCCIHKQKRKRGEENGCHKMMHEINF